MSQRWQCGGEVVEVEVARTSDALAVCVDGVSHSVEVDELPDGAVVLRVDGVQHRIYVSTAPGRCEVAVDGQRYVFEPVEAGGDAAASQSTPEIIAPMPGTVLEVLVQPGDVVEAGMPLLVLEAMKMEHRMLAEGAATVAAVDVAAGDMVHAGERLLLLTLD
jgi:biotin carboxyl carrier protein